MVETVTSPLFISLILFYYYYYYSFWNLCPGFVQTCALPFFFCLKDKLEKKKFVQTKDCKCSVSLNHLPCFLPQLSGTHELVRGRDPTPRPCRRGGTLLAFHPQNWLEVGTLTLVKLWLNS